MTRKSAPLYLLFRVLSSYSSTTFLASTEKESNGDTLFQLSLDQLVNINVIPPSPAGRFSILEKTVPF
jgi:hypothetical protein